jgi:hypothetical protein
LTASISPDPGKDVFEDFRIEMRRRDGSLTLCIQHDVPEGEKRTNWLPAPAGLFLMADRFCGPEVSLIIGSYKNPECIRMP